MVRKLYYIAVFFRFISQICHVCHAGCSSVKKVAKLLNSVPENQRAVGRLMCAQAQNIRIHSTIFMCIYYICYIWPPIISLSRFVVFEFSDIVIHPCVLQRVCRWCSFSHKEKMLCLLAKEVRPCARNQKIIDSLVLTRMHSIKYVISCHADQNGTWHTGHRTNTHFGNVREVG